MLEAFRSQTAPAPVPDAGADAAEVLQPEVAAAADQDEVASATPEAHVEELIAEVASAVADVHPKVLEPEGGAAGQSVAAADAVAPPQLEEAVAVPELVMPLLRQSLNLPSFVCLDADCGAAVLIFIALLSGSCSNLRQRN